MGTLPWVHLAPYHGTDLLLYFPSLGLHAVAPYSFKIELGKFTL